MVERRMEPDSGPYRPPRAEVGDAEDPDEFEIASTGLRFANYLLDSFFLYFVAAAGGALLVVVLGLLGADAAVQELLADGSLIGFLVGTTISVLYYGVLEALWGRTPGKLITGTRAVNADGTRLTVGRAMGRSLCRLIPFDAFSFLGGAGRPRGWHDRIPGTKVVALRRPRRRPRRSAARTGRRSSKPTGEPAPTTVDPIAERLRRQRARSTGAPGENPRAQTERRANR
jgi:uncharacterized RDD family membrane protein YckC